MEFKLGKKKAESAPNLFGLFFEDINHSLDGGLNANLVQNGWFDFCYFDWTPSCSCKTDNLRFWRVDDHASVDSVKIHENRPYSLHIKTECGARFENCGYELKEGENFLFLQDGEYNGSFYYRSNQKLDMRVRFEYEKGRGDETSLSLEPSQDFKKTSFTLKASAPKFARLVFEMEGAADAHFVGFSLHGKVFEGKNKYPFGKFDPRMVAALDMGAKFLRFPGGCLVEGDISTDYLYDWEKTIGEEYERVSKPSVWGYLQSNEIGFYEYFCLCEELGLLPIPVHHVGLICQIRTEVTRHEGFKALDPSSAQFKERVIDSVAHLIYFAKGDATSADPVERAWAQKRVRMGHSAPFDLRYVALGNENWGEVYFKNFTAAYNALKSYEYCGARVDLFSKFGIQVLSSSGVDINPQDTNPSWRYLNAHHHELIVDEHVYNTPTWFIDNYFRYDHYNKDFSKVFMGEYASHTRADGLGILGGDNNCEAALSEAVFMLGMEKNPEIVKLSCYAPLLNKKSQSNWTPDLIHFEMGEIERTPSAMVQELFMKTHGDFVISLKGDKICKNALKIVQNGVKNRLKLKNVRNFDGKPLDFDPNRYYEKVVFEFENEGDFLLTLDGGGQFHYTIEYRDADRSIFYEKSVGGLRMTREHIASARLRGFGIAVRPGEIAVLDASGKELARKAVWRSKQPIFALATGEKDKTFIKAVNISEKDEEFALDVTSSKAAEKITLVADGDRFKVKKSKANIENGLKDKLPPKSIALYVVK